LKKQIDVKDGGKEYGVRIRCNAPSQNG
jgi:hypothetical protein